MTKLDAAGDALAYSTYLGGDDDEEGTAIALDGAGRAHVTGFTASSDFPVLAAADSTFGGARTRSSRGSPRRAAA